MDNACRQYINEIARLVRDVYHIPTPLVDIEQVIQDMNGRIVVKENLDTLCDGTVAKEGDSFVIAISPNETESQRRFTLARALGHVFLHMGFRINPMVWGKLKDGEFIRFDSVPAEYQANEFALALFMPKGEYVAYVDTLKAKGMVDVRDVAKHFNVTFENALQRGRRLEVIK